MSDHWWLVCLRRGPVAVTFRVRAASSEGAIVNVNQWEHAREYSIVSVRDEGMVMA